MCVCAHTCACAHLSACQSVCLCIHSISSIPLETNKFSLLYSWHFNEVLLSLYQLFSPICKYLNSGTIRSSLKATAGRGLSNKANKPFWELTGPHFLPGTMSLLSFEWLVIKNPKPHLTSLSWITLLVLLCWEGQCGLTRMEDLLERHACERKKHSLWFRINKCPSVQSRAQQHTLAIKM